MCTAVLSQMFRKDLGPPSKLKEASRVSSRGMWKMTIAPDGRRDMMEKDMVGKERGRVRDREETERRD